jgi:segregation and condensation protein B
MSLKAKIEAIIYAAEEPVTLEQISVLLRDAVLAEFAAERENAAIEQADSAAETAYRIDDWAAGDVSLEAESAVLPELDSAEELTGPEPGPLMPPSAVSDPPQTENPQEKESFGDDDEPLFATESVEAPAAGAAGDATSAAISGIAPGESANVTASDATARKRQPKKSEQEIAEDKAVRARLREILIELLADYSSEDRGMEIRQVAGGFRMATKPQHHDVVRAFAKSLKPPIRLSLAALETLAVIAYKQPVTGPEIADIRGVESASVLGTLLDRKLITTAGRKQVIGRPMQYKTSKDFLLRFGLNDVNELPSMEEFSQLASDATIEIAPSETQQTPSLFAPEAESKEVDAPAAPASGSAAVPDETADQGSPLPTPQPEAPTSAIEPQSDAEPGNSPEAGKPLAQ